MVLNLPYVRDNNNVDEFKIFVYKEDQFNPSFIIKHRRTIFGIPLWWHKFYFERTIIVNNIPRDTKAFMIYFTYKEAEEELNHLRSGYPPICKIVYKNGGIFYIQRKKRNWNAIFYS